METDDDSDDGVEYYWDFEVVILYGPRGRRVRRIVYRYDSIVASFPDTWVLDYDGDIITPQDTPDSIGMDHDETNYIVLLEVNHEETETEGDYDSDSTNIFYWSPEHTGTGDTDTVGTVEPNTDAEAQDADPFAAHANTVGLNTHDLGVDEDEIY